MPRIAKHAQWHLNTQHMNREVVNAVKTTDTSAVHRAEKGVSGAHSEQKPHNEQKSSRNRAGKTKIGIIGTF